MSLKRSKSKNDPEFCTILCSAENVPPLGQLKPLRHAQALSPRTRRLDAASDELGGAKAFGRAAGLTRKPLRGGAVAAALTIGFTCMPDGE